MNCIYNFNYTEENTVSILLQNRVFQYGDGLFETMIFRKGKVAFLSDHFARLVAGITAFSMEIPPDFTLPYLEKSIENLVLQQSLQEAARVKLQVWRKAGGLYTPTESQIDFCITVYPFVSFPSVKEKALFFEDVRLSYSSISSFKTCSALPYVMAGIAKKQAQTDDMILLDAFGHISECIASNIFWMKAGHLFTPSLQSGCIAGVMRKQLIHKANKLQIPVHEGLFTKTDLLSADGVLCCNVAGIQVIRQIENTNFDINVFPEALLVVGQ